ncbi:hypothetical protein OJF2_15430 [Aquisphaera giovannonii]|uniref:VWFA domain-containing protein n=1 Tax=Aquisphaera giovannonii TaxID=406548 RepID=A0A5B9VYH6_9BACT|nr:hypothetical protein [Aquisphaera giovannonii]QEH33047.1 hypothetical protein OJF2_15430 [Aquisphaera giovannonii]
MADERARPSRPSWKRAGGDPRAVEPSSHAWSRRSVSSVARPDAPRTKTWKVAGVVAALAACIALILFLILVFRPPRPAAVVLVGADYAGNLAVPHNLLGWKGLQGLEAVSRTPPRFSLFPPPMLQLVRGGGTPLNLAEDWKALVDDLKVSAKGYRTLLIAVALHGGTTADSAYLLPGKATGREADRLDLLQVIRSMDELPQEQNKVLVLEGALVPADWRLGMLYNDFGRRLRDLEPEIRKVKNLWVLSGCDVDQQCWASEGMGRTAFFHYIIEALSGEAAGHGMRLNLQTLHDYVRRKVRNWAWNARGAIQEPVLLPRTADTAGSGGEPPRRPAAGVHLATAEAAPASETPPELDRTMLSERWRAFHELDGLLPHPSTYSPRRWREYRATLVRLEELARAGASAQQLAPLDERLGVLGARLRADRSFAKITESPQHNLVMGVVQGAVIDPRRGSEPEFSRLWSPPPGTDPSKVWDELRGKFPDGDAEPAQPLRCRVDDYLLQRAAADPQHDLATAVDRLRQQTRGTQYPQPVEAHFAAMLERSLRGERARPQAFWPRVRRALLVRRLAERVTLGIPEGRPGYAASERLAPWLRELVDRADDQRRLGEDQLLASDEAAWARADQSLAAAEQLYREASSRGELVRKAILARDLALSTLPDYARWMGRRRPEDLGKDDLAAVVLELWDQVHRLSDRLEAPGEESAASLEKLQKGLSTGLEALGRRFRQHAGGLAGDRRPEECEPTASAAAVPFADAAEDSLRGALWDRLDAIRKHDRKLSEGGDTPEPAAADADRVADSLRRRSRLQGRMAMATLGRDRFDAPAFKDAPPFDQVLKRIESAFEEGGQQAWWRSIAEAGDAIGLRWRGLGPEVEGLTKEEGPDADPARLLTRLSLAERLDRLIDGGEEPLPDSRPEAASLGRGLRIRGLLLWLAERAWRDHWFDEDPKAVSPYYRTVATRLVGDAARIAAKGPDLARIRQLVARNDRLKLEGPSKIIMTTEPAADATYRIAAEGDPESIPPGLPVIRPRVEPELGLLDGAAGYRLAPWRTGGDVARFSVSSATIRSAESDESMDRPFIRTSPLLIEGVFRGQLFTKRTDVELHPVPDEVSVNPAPVDPRASLAVRADGELLARFGAGSGSIAIVLDMSGSMREPTPSGRSKLAEAKIALGQVLEIIPAGTTVSLWTFSQIGAKEADLFEDDPRHLAPEKTIQRLREPVRWDRAELPGLVARLEAYRPFCDTPLVEAMWRAAATDLGKAQGLKTLLVLTDGNDTEFQKHREFNPLKDGKPTYKDIPEFIRTAFDPTGVQINMIYFDTASDGGKQLEEARKNFEEPLRGLDRPGTFTAVKDVDQLLAGLKKGIRQELACRIRDEAGKPVSEELLGVTRVGEPDRWWPDGLDAGLYTLSVLADHTYEHQVELKKGERLLVRLVDAGGKIDFRRDLYSGDFADRAAEDRSEWRASGLATVIPAQQAGDRIQVLASLEQTAMRVPDPDPIRQVHPRMSWMRLAAQGIPNPSGAFSTRWRDLGEYPAPAWVADVPRWPRDPAGAGPAQPVLRIWWLAPGLKDRSLPAIALDGDLPRRLRLADGEEVVLEGLGIESHKVEVSPGSRVDRRCLAIRIAYPKDQLHIVDPRSLLAAGIGTEGAELRIFSRARRSTALLWPVSETSLDALKSVGLYPVDELLKLAEKQQTAAAITLPIPRRGNLPEPPPPLRDPRRPLGPPAPG